MSRWQLIATGQGEAAGEVPVADGTGGYVWQQPTIVEATAYLKPSGGDDSAAMVAALTSFVPFISPSIVLGPGTFLWNTQVPALLRNTAASVTGAGKDQTFIKLSSAAPRAFDFSRIADYDTFKSIEIKDLTVDASAVSTTVSQHVLIGTSPGGTQQARLNFQNIAVRRVKITGAPHLSNGSLIKGINLNSAHTASSEGTQTTILDITIEDYECYGANQGVFVGAVNSGSTAGLGFNVFYDRINLKRIKHDTQSIPTGFLSDANIQVGSLAFGGSVHVEDVTGANSSDVGIEIDAAQYALVDTGTFIDPHSSSVLFRNFRAPLNLATQKNIARNVTGRNLNVDPGPGVSTPTHFIVGGDNTTAGYVFGQAVFEDCGISIETALSTYASNGMGVLVNAVQLKRVAVKRFTIAMPSINSTVPSGSTTSKLIDIRPANSFATVRVEDVAITLAGTRTVNGNSLIYYGVKVGGTCRFVIDGVSIDISGMANLQTNDTLHYVFVDDGGGSTVSGEVLRVRCPTVPPTTINHNGLNVSSSATCTITGRIIVRGFDMVTAAGNGLDVRAGDATNQAKIQIRDYVTARAGKVLTAATSISVTASPFAYQNLDMMDELVTIAGGTVSSVVLNQGGNVTVTTAGTYLLRAGDTLTVTYTVAPTMTKSPAV